jgi:DNA-binding CsgD family transcriptional regulator
MSMRCSVRFEESLLRDAMERVPELRTKKDIIEFALRVLIDISDLELEKIQVTANAKVAIEALNISPHPVAGRPRVLSDAQLIQMLIWKSDGVSNCEVGRRLKVSESTIRRHLKPLNKKVESQKSDVLTF